MNVGTRKTLALFALILLARVTGAKGNGGPLWQESFTARLEALALLQTLNAELLSHDSATLTLDRWCAVHQLASPAHIAAERVNGVYQAPTDEQRQLLGASATEPIRYCRVRLICGDHILSEADNWYVTSRLTEEMNRVLETTATPFGKVVMDLKPYRQTFAVNVLWWPLPKRWETKPVPTAAETTTLEIPEVIFEHRAVLYANGLPFSEVHEQYRRQLLSFPWPHP